MSGSYVERGRTCVGGYHYLHPHGYFVYVSQKTVSPSGVKSENTSVTSNNPSGIVIAINMDKGFIHLATTGFIDDPAVATTVNLGFPVGRAEHVVENFPDVTKTRMFWAACFYGNVEDATTILKIMRYQRLEFADGNIFVREHTDFIPMILGGLKMACYGKKYEIINKLYPDLSFHINDFNASKYYKTPTITQFLGDSIVKRISNGIEIMGTDFDIDQAASLTLVAVINLLALPSKTAFPQFSTVKPKITNAGYRENVINMNILDNIYKNNPQWLAIRKFGMASSVIAQRPKNKN